MSLVPPRAAAARFRVVHVPCRAGGLHGCVRYALHRAGGVPAAAPTPHAQHLHLSKFRQLLVFGTSGKAHRAFLRAHGFDEDSVRFTPDGVVVFLVDPRHVMAYLDMRIRKLAMRPALYAPPPHVWSGVAARAEAMAERTELSTGMVVKVEENGFRVYSINWVGRVHALAMLETQVHTEWFKIAGCRVACAALTWSHVQARYGEEIRRRTHKTGARLVEEAAGTAVNVYVAAARLDSVVLRLWLEATVRAVEQAAVEAAIPRLAVAAVRKRVAETPALQSHFDTSLAVARVSLYGEDAQAVLAAVTQAHPVTSERLALTHATALLLERLSRLTAAIAEDHECVLDITTGAFAAATATGAGAAAAIGAVARLVAESTAHTAAVPVSASFSARIPSTNKLERIESRCSCLLVVADNHVHVYGPSDAAVYDAQLRVVRMARDMESSAHDPVQLFGTVALSQMQQVVVPQFMAGMLAEKLREFPDLLFTETWTRGHPGQLTVRMFDLPQGREYGAAKAARALQHTVRTWLDHCVQIPIHGVARLRAERVAEWAQAAHPQLHVFLHNVDPGPCIYITGERRRSCEEVAAKIRRRLDRERSSLAGGAGTDAGQGEPASSENPGTDAGREEPSSSEKPTLCNT